MISATRVVISTMGSLAGLAGIEHGIGETLQGSVAPDGLMILSWHGSAFSRILRGEPAMTIVPSLLVTGILAILFSLIFLVWAIMFVQRKNGGLVLILLSFVMLLVGGDFGPPMLGIIVGAAGTKINAPLSWRRAHLSGNLGRLLAKLWPSSSIAFVLFSILVPILGYFFNEYMLKLSLILNFLSIGLLLLTPFTGFAVGFIQLILALALAVAAQYAGLSVLNKMTKGLNEWEQLKKGNVAVGLLMAAVVVAIAAVVSQGVGSLLTALLA